MWWLYCILLFMGFILTVYRRYEQSKKIKKLENDIKTYIEYEQAKDKKTKTGETKKAGRDTG